MNERLSRIMECIIVIIYVSMSALTFVISASSLGIILGAIVTIIVCIILLLMVAIISLMFTPTLFPNKCEKENQSNKECEEGTVICSMQNKTKGTILQYLKHRDTKYLDDNLTISQISSGKEYEKFCEQRYAISKSNQEKCDNQNKLKDMIRDLLRSIPEAKLWFKIRLFDKEFGISKQAVETKKFNKYGNKLSEGAQDSRKDSTSITAIYIKPWNEHLSYNKNNDSYMFCEGYCSHSDKFHIVNNEQIDMFVTEHWKK
jgi:flagellar basal body-associated protein FliL